MRPCEKNILLDLDAYHIDPKVTKYLSLISKFLARLPIRRPKKPSGLERTFVYILCDLLVPDTAAEGVTVRPCFLHSPTRQASHALLRCRLSSYGDAYCNTSYKTAALPFIETHLLDTALHRAGLGTVSTQPVTHTCGQSNDILANPYSFLGHETLT